MRKKLYLVISLVIFVVFVSSCSSDSQFAVSISDKNVSQEESFKFDDRSMLIPGIAACIAALVDFAYCIYLKYIEERVDSSLQ